MHGCAQVDDNIKFGMIEAISHLIHRDYEAIVKDFVTLDFIPEGTDLRPILPVLAKVFDQVRPREWLGQNALPGLAYAGLRAS